VLIVGGGVAGLTLAAKLVQQGRKPVVVERSSEYSDTGYAISLYPLGSCVLHGLGVYQELVNRSVEIRCYEMRDHKGAMLQELDLSALMSEIGPMLMLSRADLIQVLRKACCNVDIRMGATVENIEQSGDRVRTVFTGGAASDFDVLIGCDGIHSAIRTRVFGEQPVFDTGWTLWTWWGRDGLIPSDSIREYWGRGLFFGMYPILDRCMCAVVLPNHAVPVEDASNEDVRRAIGSALRELMGHADDVRNAWDDARALFKWPMLDVRARQWRSGRVALCGDAATAFLPTAGVGASNAMRSAAALANELSKSDGSHAPLALEMYAKRCQRIVEKNQSDSRKAARFAFIESDPIGWGRDELMKHYPVTRIFKQIAKSMRQPF
jgi:2-polyprenyl-6-methoxyphenol hydroxylase-like FAD-dependent oxidoreductase